MDSLWATKKTQAKLFSSGAVRRESTVTPLKGCSFAARAPSTC